jgi:hypothetical protein
MQHNFARVLLDRADDPDLRQLVGSAGRSLVENEDDWSAIVERGLKETWGLATFDSMPVIEALEDLGGISKARVQVNA